MENKKSEIEVYKEEIKQLVSNQTILNNLLQITFQGLSKDNALTAMLEGRMTGFTLQNFLQKDVYAVPFGEGYSLVNSIDYCRKIGQKNGVCGTTAPIYTEDSNGKILTCEITVKKLVQGVIGDFTALVYFDEYNSGKNQWKSKPRTMIAKVAEMHALRKACPEELAKAYIEEEYQKSKEVIVEQEEKKEEKKIEWKQELENCKTIEELQKVWLKMPPSMKREKVVEDFKNELKVKKFGFKEETSKSEETVIEAEIE